MKIWSSYLLDNFKQLSHEPKKFRWFNSTQRDDSEHCTGIAEVMGSNPVESPEFFMFMRQLLKLSSKCEDHIFIWLMSKFDKIIWTDSAGYHLETSFLSVHLLFLINRKNTRYHSNFCLFIIHFRGFEAHIYFHFNINSLSLLCTIRLRIFTFPETFKSVKWI